MTGKLAQNSMHQREHKRSLKTPSEIHYYKHDRIEFYPEQAPIFTKILGF